MRSTRTLAAAGLALSVAAGLAGCEKSVDQGPPPPPTSADLPPAVASTVPALPSLAAPAFGPDFVTTAQDANLLDQAEAQLAQQRSSDPRVKALAAQFADAHGKLASQLRAAAQAAGGARLYVADTPSELAQTKILLLGRQSGAAFDAAYLADAAELQQVFRDAVRDYARYGDTPSLRNFAAGAVAGAEQRLKAAQDLKAALAGPAKPAA